MVRARPVKCPRLFARPLRPPSARSFGSRLRDGRTLHHDVEGHFGAGHVVLRAAPPGTGIIAGGPLRAVFECLGVQDVVAKSIGTSNPHNMIKAAFEALENMMSPRAVANRRGLKVADIISRRSVQDSAAGAGSAEAETVEAEA